MIENKKLNIASRLDFVFEKYAACNALHVGERYYTYQELYDEANIIKGLILNCSNQDLQFVGILCDRSFETYSGIAAALLSGKAYMPLNPIHPPEKLRKFLEISGCSIILLGEECADAFSEIKSVSQNLIVICPNPGEKINKLKDDNKNSKVKYIFPTHTIDSRCFDINITEDSAAYLMFTSGSTGEPKGIVVSHKNLCSYAFLMIEKYEIISSDRLAQAVDVSFDLSVHNIFTALLTGASLYVLTRNELMSPKEYIRRHELTHWVSVPSVAIAMSSMGSLSYGSMPSLKFSLFCGEGLPSAIAKEWQSAAINSLVVNLYGPTEATVACFSYTWDQIGSPSECFNGLVPIGQPFEGVEARVVQNNDEDVSSGVGELYISGSQVVNGYFKNDSLTKQKFLVFDGDLSKLWYGTGDLVKKASNGNYLFIGRNDDQLKIRGYRVELLEIDHVLREACGHQMAVCIPQKTGADFMSVDGVVGFVEKSSRTQTKEALINHCKTKLPNYMVPLDIIFLDKMPLNVNGKIDKNLLRDFMAENLTHTIDFNSPDDGPVIFDISCSVCLKTLEEDKSLGGYGFIKIINHHQQDDYICHVCLKGY